MKAYSVCQCRSLCDTALATAMASQRTFRVGQVELETRTKTEIELRQQLSTYSEKFETFQDTLGKSNEV